MTKKHPQKNEKNDLPPQPQKAWLSPCLASSREIAGQTKNKIFSLINLFFVFLETSREESVDVFSFGPNSF